MNENNEVFSMEDEPVATAIQNMLKGSKWRFDAWMEAFLGKWDYSAAALIVQEAGGKVTDFYGEDHFIEGHHIIATNGNLHPFFQKLLAEVPPLNM